MATSQQILDWFQRNPDATQDQITAAMQANSVTPDQIISALGDNKYTNDISRAYTMQQYGISPQELAMATGRPVEDFSQRYDTALAGVAGLQKGTAGQITNDQISAYLSLNPNATDQQIAERMGRFQISPEQISQVTGIPFSAVQDRFNAAQVANIPTGLLGFEKATNQGLTDVIGTLRGGEVQAKAALDPAMAEVERLYNLNVGDLRQAGTQARGDIERTYGAAGNLFQPYQQAGTNALQLQQALSGALGQDAFNAAYQESPQMRFLREQGERSTLAGAAATGGVGGGRVQQELVRFGQGVASQGLQQQIQNLQALSGQGFNAASSGANVLTGMGTNLSNIGTGTAQNVAGQRVGLAGERSQYGTNLANLATSTASNVANAQGTAAQNIAMGRTNAGTALAGQIANTSMNLGNLATNQANTQAGLLTDYGNAGLNLSQQAINDQLTALQNAVNSGALSQQDFATQRSALLSGQPFTQAPPTNYGQMAGNALNAAALGYQLGGGGIPAGSEYTRPTQLPYGTQSPSIQYNFLNADYAASRLGGG